MNRALVALAACAALVAAVDAQQKSAPEASGAELSGVVRADANGAPASHAMVLIAGTDIGLLRVTSTDASGHFSFAGLPAGRFLVGAGKPSYLAALYGAGRPGRPGTEVTLTVGQKKSDVALELAKGAVIAGSVVDEHGQSVVGARVRALPRRDVGDEVQLGADAGDPTAATTDDRGMYRVFDLIPGDYVVALQPRGLGGGPMRALGPAEFGPTIMSAPAPAPPGQRPFAGRPSNGPPPGAPPPRPVPPPAGPPPPDAGVAIFTYASVYFPGSPRASDAGVIHLNAGEERDSVDLRTTLVPLGRLEGTIAGATPQTNIQILLRLADQHAAGTVLNAQTTRPGLDGRFAFANVPPGEYEVTARTLPPPGPRAPGADPFQPEWAIGHVVVGSATVPPLVLSLKPALSISGRMTFEGLKNPPDDITVRVGVRPTPGSGVPNTPDAAIVDKDGRFTIANLTPGRYRLFVAVPNDNVTQVPDWYARHAMVGGRDVIDLPLEIGADGDVHDISIAMTDDAPEIAGTARDASGHAMRDCTVIAFSVDRQFWFPQSRRIVVRQSASDGAFVFGLSAGLSAGEYYVAAISDLAPNEQFDSVLLDDLARTAQRVTLADGDSKTVDVKIAAPRGRR